MKRFSQISLCLFLCFMDTGQLALAQMESAQSNSSWEQWLFIGLLLLLMSGLFLWHQKQRDRHLQLNNLLGKDKAEKQLETLKAQVNPHFLFNSFNTLIAVIETNPNLAVEYVENLSDFYRKIMQLQDKEVVPIQEEVELVKNYAYLLEKRYGNNFKMDISIEGLEGYIVPLTLQILLENAIKHNVISKSKPLIIKIYREGKDLMSVANNLQMKLSTEESTRFGLQNLVRRYELLGKRKVKVVKSEDEFKVSIPIIH